MDVEGQVDELQNSLGALRTKRITLHNDYSLTPVRRAEEVAVVDTDISCVEEQLRRLHEKTGGR